MARWMPSTTVSGSASGALPTTTTTRSGEPQPSAAARDRTASSASPRSSASTTSASRRASQAPRASAAWAYTWAAANAISREYRSMASRSVISSPGAASASIRSSTTAMVIRTISTVCCSVTARASSRGAVPNTSALIVCGASGCRYHSVNAAIPAWATSPTQDRLSAGIARYQGSSSSIRAMAALASVPVDRSRLRTVAARRRAAEGGAGCCLMPASCRRLLPPRNLLGILKPG